METRLNTLKENSSYTICFNIHEVAKNQIIHYITVLIKLDNSIKIRFVDTNEEKWYNSNANILCLDEVPVRYLRKEKLDKIEIK